MSLELLAKITVVAVSFECLRAIRFCVDMWFPAVKEDVARVRNSRDLLQWLWITWIWRLGEEKRDAVKRAVHQSPGPFQRLELPFFPEYLIREKYQNTLGLHVQLTFASGEINATREAAIRDIIDVIYETFERSLSAASSCSKYCCATLLGHWLMQMQITGLFPKKPAAPFEGIAYEWLVWKWTLLPPKSQLFKEPCMCYVDCLKEMRRPVSESISAVRTRGSRHDSPCS
ncbi:hypothetical protein BDW62DRAFT_65554 [Aspergillus aurantiobrunneus]